MPTALKEEVRDTLGVRVKEAGLDPDTFFDMIADETTATTEEEVMEYVSQKGHPAMSLDPMF